MVSNYNGTMWNVCPACGMYSEERAVRPAGGCEAVALCPDCGAEYRFKRLPLFSITGASGTGKTTLLHWAVERSTACVHLESDILWGAAGHLSENDYRGYRNVWLRMCKNIGQAGRPVVLYGSVGPGQFEPCSERRYLAEIHTLALVCQPEILAARLRTRPAWRAAGTDQFVDSMLAFNAWFLENAAKVDPPITLFDTSHATLDETGAFLLRWIAERWHPQALDTL